MFIITKTFTDDEGHLFTKVNPKQYSTPGEAYDAMREDYLNELKSRGLEDNGSSNDDGEYQQSKGRFAFRTIHNFA